MHLCYCCCWWWCPPHSRYCSCFSFVLLFDYVSSSRASSGVTCVIEIGFVWFAGGTVECERGACGGRLLLWKRSNGQHETNFSHGRRSSGGKTRQNRQAKHMEIQRIAAQQYVKWMISKVAPKGLGQTRTPSDSFGLLLKNKNSRKLLKLVFHLFCVLLTRVGSEVYGSQSHVHFKDFSFKCLHVLSADPSWPWPFETIFRPLRCAFFFLNYCGLICPFYCLSQINPCLTIHTKQAEQGVQVARPKLQ